MITLSLCMIVKNEHDTLGRCLDSIKDVVDEIIIVDTGSTDDTKEIALKYTKKVYDFIWCDDFAKARNFSFSKATKDYIMWLDADDVVLEEDAKRIKKLKENLESDVDIVMLKYNLNLDNNNIPALSYYRERIIRKDKEYKWISQIHEVIPLKGKILKIDNIAITHKKLHVSDPKRNIRIFEKMKKDGVIFDARQVFYYARELMYEKEYNKSIKEYLKFLNMKDAWIENKISACIDIYSIYMNIGEEERALDYILKTFKYSVPRAEVCSKLGSYFILKKQYKNAIYWFEQALNCKFDLESGGFFEQDYYDFIPYIELGICYYYLNDIKKAIEYNELAGKIKPNDKIYLNNKEIYSNVYKN